MSDERSGQNSPQLWAALVVIAAAGIMVFCIVVEELVGPTAGDFERRCAGRGGVAQIDQGLFRRDFRLVVCKDGSVRRVAP